MQPRRNRRIPATRQCIQDCVRQLRIDGEFVEQDNEVTESGIRIGIEPECGFAVEGSETDAAQSEFKKAGRVSPKVTTSRGGYLKDDLLTAWQDVAEQYTAKTGLPMSADLAAKIANAAVTKLRARVRVGTLLWEPL